MNTRYIRENIISSATVWGPLEFTGWQDEQMSWKEHCYVGDWSWLNEARIKGCDAEKFCSSLFVNTFSGFPAGTAKHGILCNHDGKVVGEGILLKCGEGDIEWQGSVKGFGPADRWIEYYFRKGHKGATLENQTKLFKFQLSGPKSLYLLEKATGESLRDIQFMHFRSAAIHEVEVRLIRQGMAGEVGFEVQGAKEYHDRVYDYIIGLGKEFGLRRLGSRSAMTNHLEACFPTITHDYIPAIFSEGERDFFKAYNGDINGDISNRDNNIFANFMKVKGSFDADDISAWYRSPVELGWANRIKFDHDFIGRKALETEIADPRRTIVTLEWNREDIMDVYESHFRGGRPYDYMDIPRHMWFCMYANEVLAGKELVGITTSRTYSYYFRKVLSLCTIDIEYSKPGTAVTVVWGDPGSPQKPIRATVARAPYKTDKRRTDLTALPEKI